MYEEREILKSGECLLILIKFPLDGTKENSNVSKLSDALFKVHM